MKKTIRFVVTLALIFSFSWQLNAKKEDKGEILIPGPKTPEVTLLKNLSPGEIQEKRERYLRVRDQMRELQSRYASRLERIEAGTPDAVNIVLDSSYVCWHEDPWGGIYMTGLCHNEGTTPAVSVEVEVNFYDRNQTFLGSGSNYVHGGSNVQIEPAEGADEGVAICYDALGPNEYGFFSVQTSVSYSEADSYSVSFTPSYTGSFPTPNVQLAIDGDIYYTDGKRELNAYGKVKNASPTYLTGCAVVYLAVFNSDNTKILDVGQACIDDGEYDDDCLFYIYPFQSKSFNVSYTYATSPQISGSYLSSFFWVEAPVELLDKEPSFGVFETPLHGSSVCSSIAVTGWALDDTVVESVKIYREQGNDLVYIGDATFVEGARPDIADEYPYNEYNTRAGWGYMMLTNFLPNSGNGTFVIHAIATDIVGKTTTLGTKTIHCDNANACKPFGAFDAPEPGGEAQGSSYTNMGWVLTPPPNHIPWDGSTIHVYVDSVKLGGHVFYGNYRGDIASLFPNYANSGGAMALYDIDTTAYANGLHQIFWIATDNAGNTDGIGSRYFSIQNSQTARSMAHRLGLPEPGAVPDVANIPTDYSIPVRIKKGFSEDDEPRDVLPNENGLNRIVIKELERIEVYLSDQPSHNYSYSGYMMGYNSLRPLPVGSTLDAKKGVFYWLPGPGFLGRYHLVFVKTLQDGTMMKKTITVEIVPKTPAMGIRGNR